MVSQTAQIAASRQRERVPKEWQRGFEDWANETLSSLAKDTGADTDSRNYARWELEYRKAFGLLLVLHPENGAAVWVETDMDLGAIEAASARVAVRAAEIRQARERSR